MSFPIKRLQIQTPETDYVLFCFVVLSSKEIHHIIENNRWMAGNVAEKYIIKEVCDMFGPSFGCDVVFINDSLLI